MTDHQPCGITHDFRGTEHPPCTRTAGHVEAYCHSKDGRLFLAHPDEPAAGTDVAALLADNQHLRQQLARAEAPIEHVRRLCADPVHRFTIARADVLAALDSAEPAEETHVVADSSDDPEHTDDCPGCETAEAARRQAITRAADLIDEKLSAEPDHNRASALYELLLGLRGELPCTCARSGGLHAKECSKYVPGHELISRHNQLAVYRAATRPAATTQDGAQ